MSPGQLTSEEDGSFTAASVNLISDWVKNCLDNHPDCRGTDAPHILPNRILNVSGSGDIKLCSGELLNGQTYCALSHCWGDAHSTPPLRTTRDTLGVRQTGIPIPSLSLTFQDAIRVTRALGICYLWIDSLCIVQDDARDWEVESAKMSSIYENAHFVVAATDAKEGSAGCFLRQPPSSSRPTSKRDRLSSPFSTSSPLSPSSSGSSGPSTHIFFEPYSWPNGNPTASLCPLLLRAWCLQERLLSRRMVHFTRAELVWECRSKVDCECGKLNSPGSLSSGPSSKGEWSTSQEHVKLFLLWHKTVSLYAKLRISFPSDRLPAISGLAKKLQSRGAGRYVAGIWEENVFADLLWTMVLPGTRARQWQAPSWSWACFEGPITLSTAVSYGSTKESYVDTLHLRKPQASLTCPSGAPFRTTLISLQHGFSGDPTGKATWAELTIQAPTISASYIGKHSGDQMMRIGDMEVKFKLDTSEDISDFVEGTPLTMKCLWIGTMWKKGIFVSEKELTDSERTEVDAIPLPHCLILRTSRGLGGTKPTTSAYERVGVLSFNKFSKSSETDAAECIQQFKDAEVERITIL
ncbi:heterokaryon incompatibility protein-domain-containing protein [Podospora didyma]|uniref:Heterokaryon incompatibility protein-domain-containing protein n=1 Tax=Podospora didyma TaxID=330526 RepID=A0AAE0NY64_9PEZI|nr:heterokaryon incompatibility protein-domain-containing protein [Podospora didyma]